MGGMGTGAAYAAMRIVREGPVDWLTLNRPERLNALDNLLTSELHHYFRGLSDDAECRIVVIRGAGRAFCAGLDLKAHRDKDPSARPLDPEISLPNVVRLMRACPQPILALIQGAACGGGFSLALAADIRIAATSAKMNVAYVKIGVSGCELGTSYFLPRTVGPSVAAELMMTGRFIHAERALATGLVSEVVSEEGLENAARALVAEMLATSPIGLRKTKETLNLTAHLNDLDAILDIEDQTQRDCMRDPAFANAVARFGKRA